MRSPLLVTALLSLTLALPTAAAGPEDAAPDKAAPDSGDLAVAYEHLQKGRYEEALEAYQALDAEAQNAAAVAIGLSRVHSEQGQWAEATEALEAAVKDHPRDATIQAYLADVLYRQGRYDAAAKAAEAALKLDGSEPRAHAVLADVHAETGRTQEALNGYVWSVRYYNRAQPTDAERLLLVARGSLQYARWKRSSQIFSFVINTLCPDALKDDPLRWQAYHVSGDLLLEKYNRAQGLPELQSALAINPRAADVHASLAAAALQKHELEDATEHADRALKINPRHVRALQIKADLNIQSGNLDAAEQEIEKALGVNPHEQRTLARLAAVYLLTDGPPEAAALDELLQNLDAIETVEIEQPDRFTRLVIALAKRNPRPGYFLNVLGEALEGRRKFDLAETCYRQATRVMPELSDPKTNLGMLFMRIGKTDEAEKVLDDAFEADPFHVRVSNMRKVLKLLDGYETIQTDHFVIRVDSEFDKVLGQYMAEYLEQIYPELTEQFGYEPETRSIFEIYNNAKGLGAHQWFSARMVGLPWIQTVGASTGVIVALTSPTAAPEPFNWARVLKHEFVHIITLQQTRFNIPHWFTEALAVTAEGYPRPDEWNELLAERVPRGDIRKLTELNDGFIRPESPEDWQFAYCQSRLYAQYMTEKYGAGSIPRLLDAYKRNLPTEKAIPAVFGVPLDEFEAGYHEFLNDIVEELQAGRPPEEEKTLAEAEKAHEANPDDPVAAAAYAEQLLEVKEFDKARELAEQALESQAKPPKAAIVLAMLELRERDTDAAAAHLEAVLNQDAPHPEVLELLAKLKLLGEKYAEAAELYELGRETFPYDLDWLKGQAAVYLKMDDEPRLKAALEELSQRDPDNAGVRKKLAQMALAEKDYEQAARYGMLALHIDVMDAETHSVLGEAYLNLKDARRAVREYEVALQLKPGDAELKAGLAKAYQLAGRDEDAEALLKESEESKESDEQ